MKEWNAMLAKSNKPEYTDYKNRQVALTDAEQDYFRQTVADVLRALEIEIPVYMCDHEKLPGNAGDALGMHWAAIEGEDEFITIDNYFIHEAYEVKYCGAYDLNGETLESVICHEVAHMKYIRHTKYHAELTARYIDIVNSKAS